LLIYGHQDKNEKANSSTLIPPWRIPNGIFYWEYKENSRVMFSRNRSKPDLKAIGLRIRELRGDLRQEDVALQLGVSQGQLSKVERGRIAPTLEMLMAVADRFSKSLNWIIKGSD
jgi:DNA-binding XRE family transcriptional regulator